jgi:hypothetical protein
MSNATLPRLLTPMDVGLWLSLPVRQVERLARRGRIPAIVLPGGELAFDAAELAAWLAQLKVGGRGVWDAE